MKPKRPGDFLTPADVANLLGVSPITVRSWVKKGLLESKVTPGGHRRFLREDVNKFINETIENKNSSVKKILVVDDDDQFRGFMVEALNSLPETYEIREASDGFKAGIALAEFHPDLVFLDYAMPGMNGSEVCKLIKSSSQYASIKIIAITGHALANIEGMLKHSGADKVLFKPVTFDTLKGALDSINSKVIVKNGDTEG